MSLPVKLHQVGKTLTVEGAVVLATVPQLEQALKDLQPPLETVDLAGVRQVDSSALAWLLSLCQLTPEGVPPTFLNAPKNLLMLAQLYELDFLNFAPSDA